MQEINMIISKDLIKREYLHISKHEKPEAAVQWTAQKLGVSDECVKEAIKELEQKA